jgi:hypothetical protein
LSPGPVRRLTTVLEEIEEALLLAAGVDDQLAEEWGLDDE